MKRLLATALTATLLAGCGGGSSDPSDNDGGSGDRQVNGCIAIVGNHGSINATISGSPGYQGTIPNGNVAYVAATTNTQASFVINAIALSNGTQLLIGGPVRTGSVSNGFAVPPNDTAMNYVRVSVQEILPNCTGAGGLWLSDSFTGQATLNITAASASGVSGSFSATVIASGGGATGSKTVSGTFSATF